MTARIFLGGFLATALVTTLGATAHAQVTGDTFGTPDTISTVSTRTPVMYDTSYERDVSTGTWTQTLTYGFARPHVTLSTSGNYTSVDLVRSPGLGGQTGSMNGLLSIRAAKNWSLGLAGTFNHLSSHDIISETSQRQNRLKLTSEYNLSPLRFMNLSAALSTEFQQDHGLTARPLGKPVARLLTRYDANGDSVGVDSIFVHDQRDSTFMSGRQDGLAVNMDWRPMKRLQISGGATGARVNPRTKSNLKDFAVAPDGTPVEVADRATFESPNDNEVFQSKVAYAGQRLSASVNAKRLQSNQQYFEKLLRNQEHQSVNQRSSSTHVDYAIFSGAQISVDGVLSRSLSEYTLRPNKNSLVSAQSTHTSFSYTPSPRSRASIDFAIDRAKNERQTTWNGVLLSRSLLTSGSHRLSPRLGLDGTANVSLTSTRDVKGILDEDDVRTYLNLGGGYVISERCSTTVHFSTVRTHSVLIDPSRSGNNNFQSTYQMDAVLRLGVTPRISLIQLYLLNAIYQIYDDYQSESRNTLSRIKRIDTTLSDSLFNFATVQLIHNYLFRDSGSFSSPSAGQGRLYGVGSETVQQSISVALNISPAAGIQVSATQSLGNSRVHFPSSGTTTVGNQWNLTLGTVVDRTIGGGMALRGSAQHIAAYTERSTPTSSLNEQDDWIASATLHKEF